MAVDIAAIDTTAVDTITNPPHAPSGERAGISSASDAAGGKPNPYAAIFYASVEQGVAQSLCEVQAAEPLVPVRVRQQAWHLLSYALRLPQAWPLTRDLLLALAPKMEQEGLRDEWIPYLEGGVAQSRALGDSRAEAELCFHLGYLWRLRGEFGRAAEWLMASQYVFGTRGDQNGQARVFNQLAFVARLRGQYEEARRYLYNALHHLSEDDPELAVSDYVQGMIAIDEMNWKKAEQHHRKAYDVWVKQKNERKIAWSAENIGLTLRGQGRYSEATDFYRQAVDTLKKLRDPANQAIAQMSLGIVYSLQNRPEQALCLYAQSEQIFRDIEDTWNLANLYTNMTIEYRKLKRWDEAGKACRRGIRLYTQNGDLRWRINLLDELGLIFLEQKYHDQAEETFAYATSLLPEMQNRPGYERLLKLLSQHLHCAQQKSGKSSDDENLPDN